MNLKRLKFVSVILALLFVIGCAGMTMKQKVLSTRTTFNEMLQQFNSWAKNQPEETKVKLRENVIPVIDEASGALDAWEDSLYLPDGDPDAKLQFYLDVKTKLINLIAKYGLKIVEKEGGTL